MKNEMRTFVNPLKAVCALAIVLFFACYSVFYFFRALWPEAIVFLVIAVLFLPVVYLNGSMAVVDQDAVSLKFLGYVRMKLPWEEIQEIGVFGDRVFLRSNSKRTGTMHIYFSPWKMSDQERFNLAVKKPPKRVVFTVYSEEKITFIQSIWSAPIALYNVGDLEL